MDPSMLMAVAQAAGQQRTDFMNLGLSLYEGKKNREFAKEQSELAYQRSLEMWNKANEYNTPTAQMGRLADAGLNPNLIYGNISNMPAAKSPEYQPAKSQLNLSRFSTPTAVQTFQTARMNEAQIRNMELQNELIAVRTEHERNKQTGTEVQNLLKAMGLYVDYGVLHNDIRGSEGELIKPQQGTLWETDKSIREHQLQKLKNDLKMQVQKWEVTELDRAWKVLKNYMMDKYSVNIDKDTSLERKAFSLIDWIFNEIGVSLSDVPANVLGY